MAEPTLKLVENGDSDSVEQAARDWAKKAPRAFILCRQFGHHWTNEDTLYTIDRWHTGRQLECTRCHMVRVDIIKRGEYGPAYRRYIAPAGYSRQADAGHSAAIPRHVVWEATLSGAKKKATATEEVRAIYDFFQKGQR